ncbi:MAG: hypothetical protein AN482_08005, partial [Anabaena sp. LE011-02]
MFELSLDSQQSGFIPTPPYNNLGLSDYQDPVFAVNPANSSQLPVPFIDTVVQAINATKYILSEPDTGGLQGDLDAFGRDWSLAQARFSIGYSQEAKGKVIGIYRDVLGREPDAGELQSYLDALGRDWSLEGVRFSIAHGEEAKGKVIGIYRDVLGREPDAGGLQGWIDALGRNFTLP